MYKLLFSATKQKKKKCVKGSSDYKPNRMLWNSMAPWGMPVKIPKAIF